MGFFSWIKKTAGKAFGGLKGAGKFIYGIGKKLVTKAGEGFRYIAPFILEALSSTAKAALPEYAGLIDAAKSGLSTASNFLSRPFQESLPSLRQLAGLDPLSGQVQQQTGESTISDRLVSVLTQGKLGSVAEARGVVQNLSAGVKEKAPDIVRTGVRQGIDKALTPVSGGIPLPSNSSSAVNNLLAGAGR